jgi:hypothetical protein
MNQISATEERNNEDTTVADDIEYGRHAVPLVKDPGDYHGKHRSEDAFLRN